MRHQLHPVADAEDRAADLEQRRIASRGARVGHAFWSPRQDDADRLARLNDLGWRVRRPDLRVHRQLAKTPRDQLCVLRPEIENDDGLMAHEGPAEYYVPRLRSLLDRLAATLSRSKRRRIEVNGNRRYFRLL